MISGFFNGLRERMLAAPIGAMLAIILILGLLPAFVMGGLYVQRGLGDVEIIDNEREGVEMLTKLKPVESFVISPPIDIEQRRKEANRHLGALTALLDEHDHAALLGGSEFGAPLKEKLSLMASGTEDIVAYSEYESLIRKIGDKSGLILDPELDTYYLMTISLNLSTDISRLAADLEKASFDSSDPFDPLAVLTRHRLADATRRLKEAAITARSSSGYDLLSKNDFLDKIGTTINASNQLNAARGQTISTARRALDDANFKSWTSSTRSLDRLLEQRRADKLTGIWISLGMSGVAAILVIFSAGLVIAAIANGVRSISERLVDLSEGDYVSPVPGTEYRNDVGVIANALHDFILLSGQVDQERVRAKTELEQTVGQVRQENDALMAKALEQQRKASEQERETLIRLAADLESQISTLLQGSRLAAEKMDEEVAAMADRTAEVKREASQAANVASEIRKAVNSVPDTVRNVATSLDEYSLSLSESNRLASDAANRVHGANHRMGEFTQATSKAADMLALVSQVAQKTNMLALNASIEAVRVGEAGQGFEVVANEVKALAISTRNMAAEIAVQIGAMESANREVVDAFAEVMQIVEMLALQSANVANGMDGQTTAIFQVQRDIADAIAELSNMTTSIEAADRSATASRDRSSMMLQASKGVTENVGALDSSVRAFLRDVQNPRTLAA
jgi:methyl-accepting chemotaxis protein